MKHYEKPFIFSPIHHLELIVNQGTGQTVILQTPDCDGSATCSGDLEYLCHDDDYEVKTEISNTTLADDFFSDLGCSIQINGSTNTGCQLSGSNVACTDSVVYQIFCPGSGFPSCDSGISIVVVCPDGSSDTCDEGSFT